MKSLQRGDTILEVVIVISCLSLVLAVSVALVNRNAAGARLAQERGEAAKVNQSQVEQYKAYITSSAGVTLPADNSNFCMRTDGSATINVDNVDAENFDQNPTLSANCKKSDRYYTLTHRDGNTYTITTKWPKVSGQELEQVVTYHRISPVIY